MSAANIQPWAMTCNLNDVAILKDGFYSYCDIESIDAPSYLPSGSTVENDRTNELHTPGRYVIGGLAYRS